MKNYAWILSRNKRLSAMVHLPDTFREGTPVVVCCHGFAGDKVGYDQLTRNLAHYMETLGYGIVRFDYLGSGDSEGEFATDTFVSGWQEDLVNVLSWVKKQSAFACSPIVLYGHSLGGLVVLTHQDLEQLIAARIVFAPVTHAVDNFREIILGNELWQQSLLGQSIANFCERGFRLNSQFVQDLVDKEYHPIEDAAKLSTPLLVVHGTKDQVVPLNGSRELYEHYHGEKKFVELSTDHGAIGGQSELQATIGDWLQQHFPI